MNNLLLFLASLLILICCSNADPTNTSFDNVVAGSDINKRIAKEEKIKIDSIGILLYDGFFELDAIGPYQVLSGMVGIHVIFVALQKGIVKGTAGTQISVEHSIEEINHLDILVIPGGTTGTVTASKSPAILDWIRKIDKTSQFTTSVCTGSWILGETGLLEGKRATSNWYRAKEKLASYNIEFVNERWVKDGKYWTSAGVSAGIDMSLALVKEIKGETYAKLMMLNLEYDPKPPLMGGSVEKTDKALVDYMTATYDGILE